MDTKDCFYENERLTHLHLLFISWGEFSELKLY